MTTTAAVPVDDDGCAPAAEQAACTGPADDSFESSLGWALGTVLRAYVRDAGVALGGLPGGPRGYHVLSAAAHSLPCSQQALGKLVGVDRSVMTYLVDDLMAAGLVDRQPDPDDRRARRIVITAAGRERLATLHQRLAAVDDHVLRDLAPEDRATVRTSLRRMAQSAADDLRATVTDDLAR